MSAKYFKFGFLNPGSLGTNHDEFIAALARHDVDIMAINETWLKENEDGRAPAVPGYRLRHVPRPVSVRSGRGGGIGFYIKRGIRVRTHSHPVDPLHETVEQMWLVLTTNGVKIAIGTAYRPPWMNADLFLDALTCSINSLTFCKHTVLLGDFNINFLNQTDSKTIKLNIFLQCLDLSQLVTSPTHFTSTSETLIDLVCSDARARSIEVDWIGALGAHAFITAVFYFKKEKIPPIVMTRRNIKNIPLDKFNEDLVSVDWLAMAVSGDVNAMVAELNYNIITLFDKYAPRKTQIIKERSYPWITNNIKLMMSLRNQAHLRCRNSPSESKTLYYRELKSLVNRSLYHEKVAYFKHNINSKINHPKTLWKNLKSTLLPFKIVSELPSHFNDPDVINSHFLNVPGDSTAPASCIAYYESQRFNEGVFSMNPVDQTTVIKILSKFKSNAEGFDRITLDMFYLTLPQTLDILTSIINYSISTSTFPDLWKIAVVRPIPKVTSPSTIKDLRPISILPFLSKVLEKVVNAQLTTYLEQNNILPDAQSGFRKGRSTATALLDVTDNIISAQDEGCCTLVVLLDFSRAFDAINLTLLLSKMSYYGFDAPAVAWFRSYLTNRKQLVEIQDANGSSILSNMTPVVKGVPQGSILGPPLFILYSADIVKVLKNCKFHIYADDIQLYLSFKPKDYDVAVNLLNEDLDRIVTWSKQNSLLLNPAKTKFMLFGSKCQLNTITSPRANVIVMGQCIERVKQARNLGLIMDEDLRFESHVADCVKNCFYRLKVLYKMRPFLSEDLRVQLVESLVLSKLNYADTVVGPRLLSRTAKLIQRVQNACARFCFNIPPRSHVTPFLNKHNILKMKSRRKLHLACLLFGVIKTKCPSYLYSKLAWVNSHRQREARRCAQQLVTPHHRTAAFRGSFRYSATKCWNNIPPPIRDLKNISSFKARLKQFILSSQIQFNEINVDKSFI